MCPVTMSVIAAGAAVVGGAVSAAGAVQQGKAADKAAQMQAKELENQAELERRRTDVENANAEQQLQNIGLEAQAERAAALTDFAAGGSAITGGGFVQKYLDDSARVKSREENVVKWNRDVANWGHEANSTSLKNQSLLTRQQGKSAKRAGYYGAGGNMLEGISRGSSALAGGFK